MQFIFPSKSDSNIKVTIEIKTGDQTTPRSILINQCGYQDTDLLPIIKIGDQLLDLDKPLSEQGITGAMPVKVDVMYTAAPSDDNSWKRRINEDLEISSSSLSSATAIASSSSSSSSSAAKTNKEKDNQEEKIADSTLPSHTLIHDEIKEPYHTRDKRQTAHILLPSKITFACYYFDDESIAHFKKRIRLLLLSYNNSELLGKDFSLVNHLKKPIPEKDKHGNDNFCNHLNHYFSYDNQLIPYLSEIEITYSKNNNLQSTIPKSLKQFHSIDLTNLSADEIAFVYIALSRELKKHRHAVSFDLYFPNSRDANRNVINLLNAVNAIDSLTVYCIDQTSWSDLKNILSLKSPKNLNLIFPQNFHQFSNELITFTNKHHIRLKLTHSGTSHLSSFLKADHFEDLTLPHITSQSIKELVKFLEEDDTLKKLTLSLKHTFIPNDYVGNQLTSQESLMMIPLFKALQKNNSVEVLELNFEYDFTSLAQNLDRKFTASLAKLIKNNKTLKIIDLGGHHLNSNDLFLLKDALVMSEKTLLSLGKFEIHCVYGNNFRAMIYGGKECDAAGIALTQLVQKNNYYYHITELYSILVTGFFGQGSAFDQIYPLIAIFLNSHFTAADIEKSKHQKKPDDIQIKIDKTQQCLFNDICDYVLFILKNEENIQRSKYCLAEKNLLNQYERDLSKLTTKLEAKKIDEFLPNKTDKSILRLFMQHEKSDLCEALLGVFECYKNLSQDRNEWLSLLVRHTDNITKKQNDKFCGFGLFISAAKPLADLSIILNYHVMKMQIKLKRCLLSDKQQLTIEKKYQEYKNKCAQHQDSAELILSLR